MADDEHVPLAQAAGGGAPVAACGGWCGARGSRFEVPAKYLILPALAVERGVRDRPQLHGSAAHADAGDIAAGTRPGNEIRERIFASAIRAGMGLLLRTKRHTATGKQNQVLVTAVNCHMPATPSRCCRRTQIAPPRRHAPRHLTLANNGQPSSNSRSVLFFSFRLR
jgi:hypothetical protein